MRYILALLLTFGTTQAHAEELRGRVVRIINGDTIVLQNANRHQLKVRLTAIDAPERGQPWWSRSKHALADMIYRKDVTVKVDGQDRYGRVLGQVYRDGRNINRSMVEKGYAWVYRDYMPNPLYLPEERIAREKRLGLWRQFNPIPPWEWSHPGQPNNQGSTGTHSKATPTSQGITAGRLDAAPTPSSTSGNAH